MRSFLPIILTVAASLWTTTTTARALPSSETPGRRQTHPYDAISYLPSDYLADAEGDGCLRAFQGRRKTHEFEDRVALLARCLSMVEERYGVLVLSPDVEDEITKIVNFRFIECLKKGKLSREGCTNQAKIGNFVPKTKMWFEDDPQNVAAGRNGVFKFQDGVKELQRELGARLGDAWNGPNPNGAGAGAIGRPVPAP